MVGRGVPSIFVNHKKGLGRLIMSFSLQIIREETMKKFIYVTVAFMLMFVFIGCATMTPEERQETYDLRKDVGDSQFVGNTDRNFDAHGMMKSGWW
jgi:hypothetical protein